MRSRCLDYWRPGAHESGAPPSWTWVRTRAESALACVTESFSGVRVAEYMEISLKAREARNTGDAPRPCPGRRARSESTLDPDLPFDLLSVTGWHFNNHQVFSKAHNWTQSYENPSI